MIPVIATIVGFVFGWFRAARRGGTTGDKVQYAIGHAFAFGLTAFAILILIYQLGVFSPGTGG